MNIQKYAESRWLWVGLILMGLGLESVALYYQYVLEEWPCVLCIHFRMWIALIIILATFGLFTNENKKIRTVLLVMVLLVAIILIERSYQLLGVEQGWIMGMCSMESGLPSWFSLDKWIPWLFEIKTSCGYTPIIAFGISMAEILMVFSIILTLVMAYLTFIQITLSNKKL